MATFPRSDPKNVEERTIPRWAVIGIFLIALFYFTAEARAFLMPVTLAILLFFVFTPFRRFMERLGIGSTITAVIVTLGVVIGMGALAMAVYTPISSAMDDMPRISERLKDRFTDIRESIRPLEEAAQQIDEATSGNVANTENAPLASAPAAAPADIVANADEQATVISDGGTATLTAQTTPMTVQPDGTVQSGTQDILVEVQSSDSSSAAEQFLAVGPAFLGQTVFTLVLLFFMISSGDLLYLKIVQSFDRMRDKRRAYTALREIEESLGSYLSAITVINAALAGCVGLAMWLWGMPAPVLFGVGAFLLNFIPYLGAIGGVLIASLVALVVFDDLFTPLLVGATYLTLTSVEGQLITPYFVSRRLKMNEVVVFLTVALWAWLWSVLGMIVAVPVLVLSLIHI